ncbi:hypothetical protein [Paenibacillus sp. QZ-Y1]|uniref:hypothetical protein n=1 Tax=Paenibacillus sp. QZ-Y1 TaxID=3414511 RepID=UPI003F7A39CF
MTEDEYWRTNGDFQDDDDLPSSFLSNEDIGAETNVIILPNLNIDIDLVIANYVNVISKTKSKNDLHIILHQVWQHASHHSSLMDRIGQLQTEVEMLRFDIEGFDYDIEFIDEP